jgi:hypothetical protein
MQPRHALTARLATLQSWRYGVTAQIDRVAAFVREYGYMTGALESSLRALTATAQQQAVTVVMVAEAGRGKSELINALFFADFGRRLLPSGILHTTRCITEIRFDRQRQTCVRLLPIESREAPKRFRDILDDESSWHTILFDADNPSSVDQAFSALAETRRVSMADAVSWGVHGDGLSNVSGGLADVPKWRYAIVNMPHPLLDAGLVVVDTPGLVALTAEPEFSREELPIADAVLMVLDAVEGVTKPDLAIWKDQLGAARNKRERQRDESSQARLVVLNKIDCLHVADPLDPTEADRRWLREVEKRVQDIADLMRVEPKNVLPVSAIMALEGAFTGNRDLSLRSRLYRLETALGEGLPDDRQTLTGKLIFDELSSVLESVQASLDQQRFEALEGLRLLGELRKKNQAISEAIRKESSERQTALVGALQEIRAIKPIHTKLAAELSALTDPAIARERASTAEQALAAARSAGKAREVIDAYFAVSRADLGALNAKIIEIRDMFGNIGERHFRLLGIGHFEVHPFATHRFETEIGKAVEKATADLTNSGSMLMFRGGVIAEQFAENVGERIVHMLEIAHRESSSWMRGVFLSIERPLEELAKRVGERNAKLEKIQSAELDLAEKIAEIQGQIDIIKSRHQALGIVRESLARQMSGNPNREAE